MGHDGGCSCYSLGTDCHSRTFRMVPSAYEDIKPGHGDYKVQGNICGRMLTLGITSFLSQVSLVAAIAAINNMLRQYLNSFFQFYLDFFDVLWHQFVFPNAEKRLKIMQGNRKKIGARISLLPKKKESLSTPAKSSSTSLKNKNRILQKNWLSVNTQSAFYVKLNSMPILEKKYAKALANICSLWYTLFGCRCCLNPHNWITAKAHIYWFFAAGFRSASTV